MLIILMDIFGIFGVLTFQLKSFGQDRVNYADLLCLFKAHCFSEEDKIVSCKLLYFILVEEEDHLYNEVRALL